MQWHLGNIFTQVVWLITLPGDCLRSVYYSDQSIIVLVEQCALYFFQVCIVVVLFNSHWPSCPLVYNVWKVFLWRCTLQCVILARPAKDHTAARQTDHTYPLTHQCARGLLTQWILLLTSNFLFHQLILRSFSHLATDMPTNNSGGFWNFTFIASLIHCVSHTPDISIAIEHHLEYVSNYPMWRPDKVWRIGFIQGVSRIKAYFNSLTFVAQGFLKYLLQHESRLFSLSACSEPMMEMQRVLGIGIGSNEDEIVPRPPNLMNLSNWTWSWLCGLVCAYRLVDVVALSAGCTPNETKVPRGPISPIREVYVQFLPFNSIAF